MVSPICAHIRSLGLGGFAVFLRFARTLARTEEQLSRPDRFAHHWIALSLGPSIYSGSLLVCRARWNELFAWMSMMS